MVSTVRDLGQVGANLGKLLSVEVRIFGAMNDRETLPPGLKYFADKKIGGNAISIGVAHGESYDLGGASALLIYHSSRPSVVSHR